MINVNPMRPFIQVTNLKRWWWFHNDIGCVPVAHIGPTSHFKHVTDRMLLCWPFHNNSLHPFMNSLFLNWLPKLPQAGMINLCETSFKSCDHLVLPAMSPTWHLWDFVELIIHIQDLAPENIKDGSIYLNQESMTHCRARSDLCRLSHES